MKKLICAALCLVQAATAAAPAGAAELPGRETFAAPQVGAFAGARVRVPLGGERREKARAGLALTSTLRAGAGDLRFARGAELGFAGGEKVELAIGGTSAAQLVHGGQGPKGRKAGVSTLGWVAIGVGVSVIVAGALFLDYVEDQSE